MEPKENNYSHLIELSGSDYVIVDEQPDIRGWLVKNEVGHTIGEVDDLLFNPELQRVRYIVVAVEDENLNAGEHRKVLIPIGLADLYDEGEIQKDSVPATEVAHHQGIYDPREDGQVVIVPMYPYQLEMLPNYYEGQVDPETEMLIRHTFEGANGVRFVKESISYDPNEFYQHNHFDEDRFYERRRRTSDNSSHWGESSRGARIRPRPLDDTGIEGVDPKDPY